MVIRLPSELQKLVEQEAKERGITPSELVEEMVEQYLQSVEEDPSNRMKTTAKSGHPNEFVER